MFDLESGTNLDSIFKWLQKYTYVIQVFLLLHIAGWKREVRLNLKASKGIIFFTFQCTYNKTTKNAGIAYKYSFFVNIYTVFKLES